MALCPKRIEVDARRGRVLVDGLIFPYPLADRQPYPEVGRDDLGIVWAVSYTHLTLPTTERV